MRYFIGLDNGGTATKAAIFDEAGREVGKASVSTLALTPKPGYVERDMEEMWEANCTVLREAVKNAGIAPADIAGIGISGHGKGLYLVGEDGRPVRNGIISTDNRAYQYPEMWKKNGVKDAAFQYSCQDILACQPVSLLAWLRDNEPNSYEKIRWVFACKDYVRYRLTGEARAELTDYSGWGLVNLHTAQYDKELLRLFGLEAMDGKLPPLCRATDLCGGVTEEAAEKTGLLPGTPVIGGMFDINACAIAAGVTDSEKICMIAGTWSINEYIRETPVLDGTAQMNSLFCLPGYYLIEESSATSAGNNEWFVNQLLPEAKAAAKAEGRSVYELVNEWVAEVPPEEFVPVFLPFLMASNVHPLAKGSFVGMVLNHTRKHLARSIYEGIVFCHRWHLDRLLATRQGKPGVIRLAGGAARSDVWAQMFADATGLSVETLTAEETGALGCAICVAYATGVYASVEEAAAAMSAVAKRYEPNPARKDIYDRKYALYRSVIAALDGVWDEMQAVVEYKERKP